MTDLDTIEEWMNELYNNNIEVYKINSEGCVKITNGSGGHYVKISPEEHTFVLQGQIYSRKINVSCEKTRDSLESTLGQIL